MGSLERRIQQKKLGAREIVQPRMIAWLGPRGNFTQLALEQLATRGSRYSDAIPMEARSIGEMFDLVESGACELALVPYENSSDGPVGESHRNLHDRFVQIVDETVLGIEQVLYMKRGVFVGDIQVVASKDSALGQCDSHISQVFGGRIKRLPTKSTGEAVAMAAEDPRIAAIGSSISATAQGLDKLLIATRNFQDNPGNATTFTIVQKPGELPAPTGNDKTTFILTIPDQTGSLHKALMELSARGVNLNKIKSMQKADGGMRFLMSIDGHITDPNVHSILMTLRAQEMKILGSYPRADYTPARTGRAYAMDYAVKRIKDEAQNGDQATDQRTLVFTVKNEPGSLFRALGVFAEAGVSLTKIDSQPSGEFEEYIFYVAFKQSPKADDLITQLGKHTDYLKQI